MVFAAKLLASVIVRFVDRLVFTAAMAVSALTVAIDESFKLGFVVGAKTAGFLPVCP